MASVNSPLLSNAIRNDVPAINAIIKALAKADPSILSDLESGTKRFYEGTNGWEFQELVGSSWVTRTKFNIDAQSVDSYNASVDAVASTIVVRDTNGKLKGNLTGKADTAVTADKLASTLAVKAGGTGATTAAAARTNLNVPPTSHAATTTTYGIGTGSNYGHVKLSDSTNSTSAASAGVAATPKAVREATAKCLKTSGGALAGPLTGQQIATIGTDVRSLFIGGANGLNENAPLLCLDGPNGDVPGRWYLLASNGSQKSWLIGYPNGALELNGASVLTSAGGVLNSILHIGGVGQISFSDNSDYRTLWINRNTGNAIGVFASDSPVHPGAIFLRASDGSRGTDLWLFPDGTAEIAGNDILTSAGGTIYAPLKFYDLGAVYYDGSAASESINVGLVEENVGRSAVLSLRTSRATDAPGSFWLGARNATQASYLTGTPLRGRSPRSPPRESSGCTRSGPAGPRWCGR